MPHLALLQRPWTSVWIGIVRPHAIHFDQRCCTKEVCNAAWKKLQDMKEERRTKCCSLTAELIKASKPQTSTANCCFQQIPLLPADSASMPLLLSVPAPSCLGRSSCSKLCNDVSALLLRLSLLAGPDSPSPARQVAELRRA